MELFGPRRKSDLRGQAALELGFLRGMDYRAVSLFLATIGLG